MATHRNLILAGVLVAAIVVAACNPQRHYKTLTFFFDGVPVPGTTPTVGYEAPVPFMSSDDATAADPRPKPTQILYPHPPFRDGQCMQCHDQKTKMLFRNPEQGLCAKCHNDIPGELRYVHGPVAARACLMCHHHHGTQYPKLRLHPEPDLCFQCHDEADITTGPHHEATNDGPCTACHNPHGGDNLFFVKSGDN